jgi:hypothetical protein
MSAPAASTTNNNPNGCPAPGCKDGIDFIMPACDYCKRKHCMKHRIPESHGCRDSIRNASHFQAHQEAREVRQEKKEHDRNASDAKAKFDAKKAELAAKRQKGGGGGAAKK